MTTASKMSLGAIVLLFVLSLVSYGQTSSGKFGSLAISPDGKVVAVDFGQHNISFIYKIAVGTGVATRLTGAKEGYEETPSFSPDGKRIAFTYWPADHRRSRIVIVNVEGSDLHQWSPSGNNDVSPVFSPDNKTIIFGRFGFYGSYSPIAQPHPHEWDFFASDLDGANVRQLTQESFYGVSPASVSPDGRTFLFVNKEDNGDVMEIRSLEVPAQAKQTLRPALPHRIRGGAIYAFPNFMPDGKSILFMAASDGKPWGGYDYDIYQMELATGTVERLTRGNGYATDLRLSADGGIAVFLKWRSDWQGTPITNEPYLLDVQSRKVTPLVVTGLN
jgi:Tol biopolymer transport system component